MVGEPKLIRDKAPSTKTISAPKDFISSITSLSQIVFPAPARSTFPELIAWEKTKRPKAVERLLIESIFETISFWGYNCCEVTNIVLGLIIISGYAVFVTWSVFSPSIPIEVIPTVILEKEHKRERT